MLAWQPTLTEVEEDFLCGTRGSHGLCGANEWMEESEVSWGAWGRLPEEPRGGPAALWNSVSPLHLPRVVVAWESFTAPTIRSRFSLMPSGAMAGGVTSPQKGRKCDCPSPLLSRAEHTPLSWPCAPGLSLGASSGSR